MDMGGKNGHIRVPTYQQQQQVRKRQQDFLRTANDNADERAAPLQSSCASTVHAQSPSVSCAASFDQWQPLQPSYASTAHAHIPAAPLAKWNSGKRSSDTTAEARAEALHAEALHSGPVPHHGPTPQTLQCPVTYEDVVWTDDSFGPSFR